ncbi:hypothetical protein CHARACLAT_014894 [Characodon lateralis]|uniref:Uncharacterized protein n=1 Tax=Characodon lateralis TaxID=208331 RepID=A0ABU7F321_9TELE|nr:hypothetical protein [Characodon lateralis]
MNENTGYTYSISFYLTLHMIDDFMASLDPIEFMSFCQQKTSTRWASPDPSSSKAVWKESDLWEGGEFYAGSGITGKSSATPLPPSEFNVEIHGCRSQQVYMCSINGVCELQTCLITLSNVQ